MANHMKLCGCRQCRAGMHTKSGSKILRRAIRVARKAVKRSLKAGDEKPHPKFGVEYTD